jgi:ABC-2 type transport system permease protein
MNALARIGPVFRRELRSYFATPLAAVFLVTFLFLAGLFTFNLGGLYERGQADLRPLLSALPWLYLFLVPAISMRLWAEERRTGTVELLVTLPTTLFDLVVGKFLAAWLFLAIATALTAPIWITVAWLGDPDHGATLVGYVAAILLGGAFLAIGSCLSALTKNQVIAFVLCAVVCFVLLLAGLPPVLDYLRNAVPPGLVEAVAQMSALTHYESLVRGVLDGRDALYFVSIMVAALLLNGLVIDWKKAD